MEGRNEVLQGWMEGIRLEGRCDAGRKVQGWKEGAMQAARGVNGGYKVRRKE